MSEDARTPQQAGLNDLILAATAEDWDVVDEHLPGLCNSSDSILWAFQTGVADENDHVRDLAVSIVESSDHELAEDEASLLHQLLASDTNPYVQFRSAFALYKRGDRSEEVMAAMQRALEDEDVREISQGYLDES